MRKLLGLVSVLCGLPLALAPAAARAGGCYVCGAGSKGACRDYCRYEGADTFDARHRCEAKGCRVSGTSTCPAQGGAQVCLAPAPQPAGEAVAQCPADRSDASGINGRGRKEGSLPPARPRS